MILTILVTVVYVQLVNYYNPGGLINAFGASMLGAIQAGDTLLSVADASWVIGGAGNVLVLGRYADGYVEIGGVVGANTFSIPTAVWNTYLAQTTNDGASFQQNLVSNNPNHVGVICTLGSACGFGTRNLLDLFKVAIDPNTGRAAVIYTDDTITKDSSQNPLPQVVLAQQK